jgi:hypothetical protein
VIDAKQALNIQQLVSTTVQYKSSFSLNHYVQSIGLRIVNSIPTTGALVNVSQQPVTGRTAGSSRQPCSRFRLCLGYSSCLLQAALA